MRICGRSVLLVLAGAASMKVYVDGVLEAESTDLGLNTAAASNSSPLFFGHWNGSLFFEGNLDEVRIWNVLRSQTEIRRDMRRALDGSKPGLVGYWPMDEAAGPRVYDRTSRPR